MGIISEIVLLVVVIKKNKTKKKRKIYKMPYRIIIRAMTTKKYRFEKVPSLPVNNIGKYHKVS